MLVVASNYLKYTFNLYNDIIYIINLYTFYSITETEYYKIIKTTYTFNKWINNSKILCNMYDLIHCKYFKVSHMLDIYKKFEYPRTIRSMSCFYWVMLEYRSIISEKVLENFTYNDYFKTVDENCIYFTVFYSKQLFTETQLTQLLFNKNMMYNIIFKPFGNYKMSIFHCICLNNTKYFNIISRIILDNKFEKKHLFYKLYDFYKNEHHPEINILMILCYSDIKFINKLLQKNIISSNDMKIKFDDLSPNDIINF